MSRTTIVLSCLALLTALSLTPLCAEPAGSPQSAPVVQAALAGCGADLALPAPVSAKGETCPVAASKGMVPDFMVKAGGRTCRCSCGQPCKTDADCGPGGRCTAGITCC
ncbi:MAG TPA: hypothetical protein VMW27_03930 [Thermoanaerobaculia bacterium]|nr:hypothetical protein [Thermoanaerobaculia bacterium]